MSQTQETVMEVHIEKDDRSVQVAGWLGAVLILLAYALTSYFKLPIDGPLSLVLNISGSAMIAHASWRRRAYQSVFTNSVWILIGLATLVKVMLS
jgi:hypothetical protein